MVERNTREEKLSGTTMKKASKVASPTSVGSPSDEEDSNELGPTTLASNGESGDVNDGGGDGEQEAEHDSKQEKKIKLYKSPRFTGYLTMFLSSIINYHGVLVSQSTNDVHVIASTKVQRQYGYVVAVISCIASGFCVVCHLDRCSCLANTWKNNLFAPKSKFETILDIFLFCWWFMATIIQTR